MTDEQGRDAGERIDLSPLDPTADEEALHRYVLRVRTAATAELVRRQNAAGLWVTIVLGRRPILAACGIIAVVSIAVLLAIPRGAAYRTESVAEALGIPKAYASWISAAERPAPGEILEAEGSRQ